MQTFLPYDNFEKSLEVLDWRRLGKQRGEAFQILKSIATKNKKAWYNHPAAQMWKDHTNALKHYMNLAIQEWIKRGYKNNMELAEVSFPIVYPDWFGGVIHSTHRANLIRKDPEYYSKFGWFENENPDMPYYWPTKGIKIIYT